MVHGVRYGVPSAAPPPIWGGQLMAIEIAGKPSQENWGAQMQAASDGFFATMRIPLLEGRIISEEDYVHARMVAVINRSFVKKYLAGENPLGRISCGDRGLNGLGTLRLGLERARSAWPCASACAAFRGLPSRCSLRANCRSSTSWDGS